MRSTTARTGRMRSGVLDGRGAGGRGEATVQEIRDSSQTYHIHYFESPEWQASLAEAASFGTDR